MGIRTVFLSSTGRDLHEYREAAYRAIEGMDGFHCVRLEEEFGPRASDPDALGRRTVAECDLFVGITGHLYGSIVAGTKQSFTEREYEAAVAAGKPRLLFVAPDDFPVPGNLREPQTQWRKQQAFRKRVRHENVDAPFGTPEDLARRVAQAIYNWAREQQAESNAGASPALQLDTYIRVLTKRYQRIDLDALTPPQRDDLLPRQLQSVFVEQHVRENPPPVELPREVWERLHRAGDVFVEDLARGAEMLNARRTFDTFRERPSLPVLDVLTDSGRPHTVILGDPGSGKSTLLRYVLLSLLDPIGGDERLRRAFNGHLPLLIELRSYAGLCAENRCDTFLSFLDYLGKTEGWQLSGEALEQYLRSDNGRAVVLFDGLDEIFDPERRERITRQIVGFAESYPKARIVITSRPVGYRRAILSDAGFAHFQIQDLEEPQVATFVDRWYGLALPDRPDEAAQRRERILHSFRDSASIRQLAGNPMLLTIMAIIGKHQELPRERWKLYDHAASVLIQHWDVNKHVGDLLGGADFLGEDDKKELLRGLAYRMQGGEGGLAGNFIHREELQEEFEGYLTARYQLPPDRSAAIARRMIDQFRERNFILSLYGANVYGFVHRAFLEFFCASAFVHRFEKTRELTLEQLKTEVYGAHWEDRSWHEVLRLICGQLDESFAGEIIDFLTREVHGPWPWEVGFRPAWNVALAVQCLTEVRNLNSVAGPARRLLKTVCKLLDILVIRGYGGNFVTNGIALVVESIGPNWPHRDFLATWLGRAYAVPRSWHGGATFGNLIGIIAGGSERIYQAIRDNAAHENSFRRAQAALALAAGWRDIPEAFSLLLRLAEQDQDSDVRMNAVSALAERYKEHAQVLPLLLRRAEQDQDSDVRMNAVSALAEHYKEHAQVLPLLLRRAEQDQDNSVHWTAVSTLAEHYKEHAQVLPLLLRWARQGKNRYVRYAATFALAQYYKEDAAVLPLLLRQAERDKYDNVRLNAISALIQHYKEDATVPPLLLRRAEQDKYDNVRLMSVSALAEHHKEHAQVLPLLLRRAEQDHAGSVRRTAISALAEHHKEHAQVLLLLLRLAEQDQDSGVRLNAVSALAEHHKDNAQVLPLLLRLAEQDQDSYVRSAAVRALAEHYKDNAQVLPLLLRRAEQDQDSNVRSAAVSALAEHYKDDAQVLSLLLRWAEQDKEWYVRYTAVSALIEHYKDDAEVLPLIKERAIADDSPDVRSVLDAPGLSSVRLVAIEALARYWPEDPEVLALLRERAANDPTEWLREWTRDLLDEITDTGT